MSLSVEQYIQLVIEKTGAALPADTVDTLKCGDPKAVVTGAATTFMATRSVLERAAALGTNLDITHEPTFYNHLDQVDWLTHDKVYQEKSRFIKEKGLAVWRFHDGWHSTAQDGILQGMLEQLGWLEYQTTSGSRMLKFPQWTARQIALTAKEKLGLEMVRLAGEPEVLCGQVSFLAGAWGGRRQMQDLQTLGVRAVVCGESPEWETCEYVRDASAQGNPLALVVLGHAPSEESGMAHLALQLKKLIPEVPACFIPAGNPFQIL